MVFVKLNKDGTAQNMANGITADEHLTGREALKVRSENKWLVRRRERTTQTNSSIFTIQMSFHIIYSDGVVIISTFARIYEELPEREINFDYDRCIRTQTR